MFFVNWYLNVILNIFLNIHINHVNIFTGLIYPTLLTIKRILVINITKYIMSHNKIWYKVNKLIFKRKKLFLRWENILIFFQCLITFINYRFENRIMFGDTIRKNVFKTEHAVAVH